MSYVAQVKPVPPAVSRIEYALLCKVFRLPGQALRLKDVFAFSAFGGPAVSSVVLQAQATMSRAATKTVTNWWGLLRALQVVSARQLPAVSVIKEDYSPKFWDEPPIVKMFYVTLVQAANLSIHPSVPPLVPNSTNAFSLPSLPPEAPLPGGIEISQTVAYKAIRSAFLGSPVTSWRELFVRRLIGVFQVEVGEASSIDVEAIFSILRKLPAHISVTWVKTISNAWCTSSRFHEERPLGCIFGCECARDETRHYLCCPVLGAIVCDALDVSESDHLRARRSVLIAMGLQPISRLGVFFTYMSYTLYHTRKNTLLDSTLFSEANIYQYKRLAQAHRLKMLEMLRLSNRDARPFTGRRSPRGQLALQA